ncbi:hypothetical protein Pmani_037393 [Petrolisthes manimaculis]|uniref:Fork-head domain-containing protein n=1 Tax=Petrolisthes manimaculis TaxID=1843537 RepID=A0AAE1NHR7_9EUCA|nr:hypothetical protein Pmani_037393 [Petrolisthes manimaculis]
MAELNKSLTAMDWLPRLNAPKALVPTTGVGGGGGLGVGGGLWLMDSTSSSSPLDSPHHSHHHPSPELVQADSSTPPSPPTNGKPPYSYASLITMAINSTCRRKMTLAEIYHWITDNFTFYKQATSGWKNSVRHNLSLNKCFKKVARTKDDPGKGSYWAIDPTYTAEDPVTRKKKQACQRFNPYLNTNPTDLRGDPIMPMLPGKTMLNPAAAMMVAAAAAGQQQHNNNHNHNHHHHNNNNSNNKGGLYSNSGSCWSEQMITSEGWNTHQHQQHLWNTTTTTLASEGFMVEGQVGVNVPVGENDLVHRGSPVDGITMNDCDLRLLNNLTPELLREYADLLTSSSMVNQNVINSMGLGTTSLPTTLPRSVVSIASIPPSSSSFCSSVSPLTTTSSSIPPTTNTYTFTPLTTCSGGASSSSFLHASTPVNTTPLPPQTSGETLESLVADPLLVSNAVPPDDVLLSPQQACSSPGELTLDGSFSLSGHSDTLGDSTTSLSALSQTVSAVSHGSGGTVTIMRREPVISSPPQQLSEPLTRLLSPLTPPDHHQHQHQHHSSSLTSCGVDDDGLDSVLEYGLKDMRTAIQVGLITGSGPHSDDEEITDDFNWDKLL